MQSILGKMPICSFGNFLPVNSIANQKKPSHQKQKNLHLIDNHWHTSIVETIKEDTDNFYNVLCFQDHPKEWKREIPQLQRVWLLMQKQKQISCRQCEFTCARTSHLKRHMQTHSGEKQFNCKQCEHTCATNGNLKAHMNTYSGRSEKHQSQKC